MTNTIDITKLIPFGDTLLSDCFKDAYGFRPRGTYKDWWTREELEAEFLKLEAVVLENSLHTDKEQARALVEYNTRISKMQADYGLTRKGAVNWDIQAEMPEGAQHSQDLEHYFWNQGLSFKVIDQYKVEFADLIQ